MFLYHYDVDICHEDLSIGLYTFVQDNEHNKRHTDIVVLLYAVHSMSWQKFTQQAKVIK
jgi:hypothetical protein